jgi:GcrA cell cycle regulator
MGHRWNDGVWTLEQSELLKDCVLRQRLSFAESAIRINEQFGTAYTRNAVIGRAHRIELVSPTRARLPHKPRKPQPYKPRPHKPRERSLTRVVAGGFDGPGSVTSIAEIKPRCIEIECLVTVVDVSGCRYPSEHPPFLFCDGPQQPGSSFCPSHHAICHPPRVAPRQATWQREVA